MPLPRPSEQYFRKVNLELTTVCNLTCPECAVGTNGSGKRKQHHHSWEYLVEAARWLYGTHSIVVMGGEPTTHPKFAEFVPKLRELFGCAELILWTNGFNAEKYSETLKCFDAVYATLYDQVTAPWLKRPNTSSVDFIKINYQHSTMEQPHIPLSLRGSGELCERGIHGPLTYADGKIYGCCVAVGLEHGVGVVPLENWKEELLTIPLPCEECCFSPG